MYDPDEPSMPLTVLGVGEVLWDLLPEGRKLGGAPANCAYHARTLGARAMVGSAVGADAEGGDILDALDGLGLDRAHVAVDEDHPTGTVDVTVDPAGIPHYTIVPDVAWDYIPATGGLLAAARAADAVVFGSLCQRAPVSRATVTRVVEAARPDALRVFDANLRFPFVDREVIEASLRRASVVKLNDEELPRLADWLELRGGEAEQAGALAERYALRAVAITRGSRGSLLLADREVCEHPGVRAVVVDTVGAGDAFTAALAIGLLHRQPLAEVSETANRLAAWVCAHAGATPPPPDWL